MEIMKLIPTGKDYLWGGTRLREEYGKKIDLTPLAETWECSVHPDVPSYIANGEFKGLALADVLKQHPEYIGTKVEDGKLPVLVKFIDAKKDLSVQVHPDDAYAREHEGYNGKTEMWYVVDADEGAHLIYGFQHKVTEEILRKAVETGTLDKHLQKVEVHKGDTYFVPAPLYRLAFCRGYEAECEKYYDYGTVSPMIYEEGEHLLNLLEFFRTYPDDKVQIDDYLNYCQMFYDYTEILEADYFQTHRGIAEDLAMQILISVLKGDQNYHYENIAFVCDASGQILRLAPMIDHEFSTCFMFPDNLSRHNYWFGEVQRSIEGKPVQPDEYKDFPNEKERRLMEKSATCLHRNLVYIKEHYPEVTASFLKNVSRLKRDLLQKRESFFIRKAKDYPDHANSDAYRIGKARYKDHDEEKAAAFEKQYGGEGKEISFDLMNCLINYEVQEIIEQMERILR